MKPIVESMDVETATAALDPWYLENLRCPVDGTVLRWNPGESLLHSPNGRFYPVIDGVPVMLRGDVAPTLEAARASVRIEAGDAPWYLKSIFHEESERPPPSELQSRPDGIDPVVSHLVGHTNGLAYWHMVGRLKDYPIPDIRLEQGHGRSLLDIGCGWGRWCVAAARKGWKPVGLDPSLGAVMAARRVARQLGVEARFVVGDARHMPFKPEAFDAVFSYSVLQHFSESEAEQTICQIGRLLKPGGYCLVQMPTRWGVRCLYNQIRRGFRRACGFEVRYWPLKELARVFEAHVGPMKLSVDCYLGIGWQPSDAHLMPLRFRRIIAVSEWLRAASRRLPLLLRLADSVYVEAKRPQKSTDA